jgi:hypothetical protein
MIEGTLEMIEGVYCEIFHGACSNARAGNPLANLPRNRHLGSFLAAIHSCIVA